MYSKSTGVKSILSTFRSRGIGRRFAIYILLFSSIVTLLITIIQLFNDYRQDVISINRTLQEIQIIYQDTLSTAVWVHNKTAMNLQLDGMMRLPTILYVRVDDELGEEIEHRGTHREQRTLINSFELSHVHREKKVFLGKVNVLADLNVVYKRLFHKLVIILISQGIKTFIVSLFILMLFHLLVGRFLLTMADVAKEISAGSYRDKLEIGNDDELSDVSASFNDMTNKLVANMAALEKEVHERCLAQHTLEEHKKHLEDLVKEKTGDLLRLNETLEQRVAQEVEKNLKQERLLIQQSRHAAMGEMIGNIAHQWRQPLNALGLLIFNIKDAYQFNTLDAAYIDQAVADGRRMVQKMSTTISDFSNFFRPNKEIIVFSALEQIREAVALVESSFQHSNISIHIDASQDIKLMGFPNEYSQVLLNLLSNAKEAILLHNQMLSGRVDIVITEQDGQGCVSVRDNGGGIPDEILDRIFEPYFSTKEKGSGIGLYMSKMIIEHNMNGGITAKNIEGGAEFTVCTPFAK